MVKRNSIIAATSLVSLSLISSEMSLVSSQQYSVQFQLVGGTRFVNHPGTYGEKGETYVPNKPAGRFSHSMCVNPINGKLLIWGGLLNQNEDTGMSFNLIKTIYFNF